MLCSLDNLQQKAEPCHVHDLDASEKRLRADNLPKKLCTIALTKRVFFSGRSKRLNFS